MHFRFKKCGPFFRAAIIFATIACYAPSANAQDFETNFLGANEAAMLKMMTGMTIKPTGEMDHDFVAMMIPHHQGAIDMAQAELLYGHNQQLFRISQEIVAEQEQEIAAMRLAIGEPASPSWAIEASAKSGKTSVPAECFRPRRRAALFAAERHRHVEDDGRYGRYALGRRRPRLRCNDGAAPSGRHRYGAGRIALRSKRAAPAYGAGNHRHAASRKSPLCGSRSVNRCRQQQPAPTQASYPDRASISSGSGATQMQMPSNMNMAPTIKANPTENYPRRIAINDRMTLAASFCSPAASSPASHRPLPDRRPTVLRPPIFRSAITTVSTRATSSPTRSRSSTRLTTRRSA